MGKVFIALGGNVGNVSNTFEIAIKKIEEIIGPIIKLSSRYKTEPWGNKKQDFFLNQVIYIETTLAPGEVLKKILDIEKMMGRNRDKDNQYAPRTIDIDILFYDKKIISDSELVIPHPRLHVRNFVLTPLFEIAPDFIHPLLNKTIRELCKDNLDTSTVIKE